MFLLVNYLYCEHVYVHKFQLIIDTQFHACYSCKGGNQCKLILLVCIHNYIGMECGVRERDEKYMYFFDLKT